MCHPRSVLQWCPGAVLDYFDGEPGGICWLRRRAALRRMTLSQVRSSSPAVSVNSGADIAENERLAAPGISGTNN
jgi:hypothetical protein